MIEDDKADFSSIYDRPEPAGYYATLAPLEYCIPDLARPVVAAVHAAAPPGPILDICCSYGVNATVLRHDVDVATMARHLAGGPDRASTARFLADRQRDPQPLVLGLDISANAVAWACDVGLMAAGWAENLEDDEPSAGLVDGIADVRTISCTGGVGYVTGTTFGRLLDAHPDPSSLHIVLFVLRVFDTEAITDLFAGRGLVTERVPGVTFRQRRFADRAEAAAALHDVRERGLDPAGKEADGWFHADCLVSRPVADAARVPLAELLAGAVPTRS